MYHKIDGVTVAIGVLDILDTYMSSQYFLWDPEYAFLGLGKFSVVREIEYMRKI
jgi:arginyl-tRNA---protein transferase